MDLSKKKPYTISWAKELPITSGDDGEKSIIDLRNSWLLLRQLITDSYCDFNSIENYLALIDRKVDEAIETSFRPETSLMDLANQLEDVLIAMDIENTIKSSSTKI